MSRFTTGVTIVSGIEDGHPVGFTCQSFISLSIDPPFVAVAPARTSTSWPRIARAGISVSMCWGTTKRICAGASPSPGATSSRAWTWHPAPATGAPVIEGSLAWVDCRLELVHDAGDHELIIGKVLDLGTSDGFPLLFFRSKFATLARHTGDGETRRSRTRADINESEVIADVIVVEPDAHGDERGRFVETYRRSWFPLGREMTQANRSEKQAGAIVGLHYHLHQADYWYVLRGTARVVLHDLRQGSPTDGATLTLDLDGDHDRGLFIPPGVAHGFASLTDLTLWYLVDSYYNPEDELGVAWDDPAIGADWGLDRPGPLGPRPVQSAAVGDPPGRPARGPAFAPDPSGQRTRPTSERPGHDVTRHLRIGHRHQGRPAPEGHRHPASGTELSPDRLGSPGRACS